MCAVNVILDTNALRVGAARLQFDREPFYIATRLRLDICSYIGILQWGITRCFR